MTSHEMLPPQVGTEHPMLSGIHLENCPRWWNQDFIVGHEGYRCDNILQMPSGGQGMLKYMSVCRFS